MVSPNEPTGFENYSSAELHENIVIEILGAAEYSDSASHAAFLDNAAYMTEELIRRGE